MSALTVSAESLVVRAEMTIDPSLKRDITRFVARPPIGDDFVAWNVGVGAAVKVHLLNLGRCVRHYLYS
jgi:hypothetical protein